MSSTTPVTPRPGEEATTRLPPTITSRTHIIGLCGVSDARNRASPKNDGWFVSDFYLWKGMMKGMGASQQWITCLDPETIVAKYESQFPSGPYVQGDPFDNNRVITLSRGQITEARRDLRVVVDDSQTTLSDTFLVEFRRTCERAAQAGEPVLLIVTTHGDIEHSMGGLCIGNPDNRDVILTKEQLGATIRHIPYLKLTTFLTSCFSGEWVITPQWAGNFDSTVVAAAQEWQESHAWVGSTAGRYGGGVMSTLVLQEILAEAGIDDSKLIEQKIDVFQGAIEDPDTRSWKQWCDDVRSDMSRYAVRGDMFGSTPLFTPTGGHDKFWARSGIPVGDFYSNWSTFPKLPKSQHANPTMDRGRAVDNITKEEQQVFDEFIKTSPWGTVEINVGDDSSSDGSDRVGSWSRAAGAKLKSKTRDLVRQYLASNPGLDTVQENRSVFLHCRQLLSNQLDISELVPLEHTLSYRLFSMDAAEKLLKLMRVTVAEIGPITAWKWEDWSSSALGGITPPYQRKLFEEYFQITRSWPLCTPPPGVTCGAPWYKPSRYLAAAFLLAAKEPKEEFRLFVSKQQQPAREIARAELRRWASLRGTVSKAKTWRIEKGYRPGSPKKGGARSSLEGLFQSPGEESKGTEGSSSK